MTKKRSKSTVKRVAVKPCPAHEDVVKQLEGRIADLEARQSLIIESFKFIADETRGLYGLSALALVCDGISEKLAP